MSNDVVVSKKNRDSLLGLLLLHGSEDALELAGILRTAPETVSLEGVERFDLSPTGFAKDGIVTAEEWVRFSDLRRLIPPVQPSAVVSRQVVRNAMRDTFRHIHPVGPEIGNGWIEEYIDALQLPQPVAPVQSGGVDDRMGEKTIVERDAAEDLIEQVAIHFGCTEEWSSVHSHFDCVREAIVSHITTTQSAPSITVTTIPSSKEVRAFADKYHLNLTERQIDGIISLFIERTKERGEDPQITRAFQVLELHGVPRERAGTVDNGIEVLTTRYRKAHQSAPSVGTVPTVDNFSHKYAWETLKKFLAWDVEDKSKPIFLSESTEESIRTGMEQHENKKSFSTSLLQWMTERESDPFFILTSRTEGK